MHEAFVGRWLHQPHFSPEALAPLHDLNHRFLELLAARRDDWHAVPQPDAELAAALAALAPAQRHAAARCPYAIFDLRFNDDEHWRLRLERPGSWRVADGAARDEEAVEFVRLALFYAWHVVCTAQLDAQVLLGMNEYTARAFRAVTLNSLPYLASSEAPELKARWGTRGTFWSSLLRAATRADVQCLKRAQLFGLQLFAAARLP